MSTSIRPNAAPTTAHAGLSDLFSFSGSCPATRALGVCQQARTYRVESAPCGSGPPRRRARRRMCVRAGRSSRDGPSHWQVSSRLHGALRSSAVLRAPARSLLLRLTTTSAVALSTHAAYAYLLVRSSRKLKGGLPTTRPMAISHVLVLAGRCPLVAVPPTRRVHARDADAMVCSEREYPFRGQKYQSPAISKPAICPRLGRAGPPGAKPCLLRSKCARRV